MVATHTKKRGNSGGGGDEDFDAWGIGQRFVVVKFLGPLKEYNLAAKQARYGIVDGVSEFNNPQYYIQNRLNGLDRMYFIMITLSYDVYSFLNKYAKANMLALRNRIKTVKKLIKYVSINEFDYINHVDKFQIDEELFETCFDTLLDINTQMIEIMNQTGFIFRLRDELDMDDFMEDVIHGG